METWQGLDQKSVTMGEHQHLFRHNGYTPGGDKCECGATETPHIHAWGVTTDETNRFGGVVHCIGRTPQHVGCRAKMTIWAEGFDRWDGEWAPDSYLAPGFVMGQSVDWTPEATVDSDLRSKVGSES